MYILNYRILIFVSVSMCPTHVGTYIHNYLYMYRIYIYIYSIYIYICFLFFLLTGPLLNSFLTPTKEDLTESAQAPKKKKNGLTDWNTKNVR